MSAPTFHILNFGCRASQADGAALKQQLLQAGLREAARVEESAVAILNTCTVTASADAEVRQFVRRIHRRNPGCRILVTGCYAQRAPQEIAGLEGIAWVVGNSHKHLISSLLSRGVTPTTRNSALPAPSGDHRLGIGTGDSPPGAADSEVANSAAAQLIQIKTIGDARQAASGGASEFPPPLDKMLHSEIPNPQPQSAMVIVGKIAEEFHFAPVFADDRTRPTLKIQDGCDARCSFCIIPSVRGRSRSLPPEKVLEQVRQLEDAGYHEVVLSGINLGGYGRDLDRRINFLGIVERILGETSIARIRISSIEPMDASPTLIRLVSREPRMAQHFHVPLQSGSDRILRRMNRRYWTRQYSERIFAIHEQIPGAALGADVMVGFPGETDEDHAASLQFIASLPYTYLHIFPFSARPATPAATAAEQVNGRVARERSNEIRSVINAKRQAFHATQLGQTLPALTLDETEDGDRVALTTNYLKVALPGCEIPPNTLLDVTIGRAISGRLFGYAASAQTEPVTHAIR